MGKDLDNTESPSTPDIARTEEIYSSNSIGTTELTADAALSLIERYGSSVEFDTQMRSWDRSGFEMVSPPEISSEVSPVQSQAYVPTSTTYVICNNMKYGIMTAVNPNENAEIPEGPIILVQNETSADVSLIDGVGDASGAPELPRVAVSPKDSARGATPRVEESSKTVISAAPRRLVAGGKNINMMRRDMSEVTKETQSNDAMSKKISVGKTIRSCNDEDEEDEDEEDDDDEDEDDEEDEEEDNNNNDDNDGGSSGSGSDSDDDDASVPRDKVVAPNVNRDKEFEKEFPRFTETDGRDCDDDVVRTKYNCMYIIICFFLLIVKREILISPFAQRPTSVALPVTLTRKRTSCNRRERREPGARCP